MRTSALLALAFLLSPSAAFSQDKPTITKDAVEVKKEPAKKQDGAEANGQAKDEVLAGHSNHGEVFNEGARQKAYLMSGTGDVHFPATTKNERVQKFIDQGLGQMHGFWYFESERSFRQAAALDPDCATAYWGMAYANLGNEKRAKGFIEEAMKRKDKVSERERMYIEALNTYINSKSKKERGTVYVRALEKILYKHPEDIEGRALLALHLWKNRGKVKTSHIAIDAVMQQVFAKAPMHPTHHYRIHLWDYERPETAISSAARSGQSAPAIAHMWHMGGHIFSRLKRYNDAAWQQEASARVDHAHMMRDHVLPDQIHNFAHNNEWLVRNLNHVGRVGDAIRLAANMIELPRHPKYNTMTRRGSTMYGRTRLFETLRRFERWQTLVDYCNSAYLEPTKKDTEQDKRLRYLATAYYRLGQTEEGDKVRADVQSRLDEQKQKRDEAADKARAKVIAAAQKKSAAKKDDVKKDDVKKDDVKKDDVKKDDVKKDEAKKDEAKKDEAKKDEAQEGDKTETAAVDAKTKKAADKAADKAAKDASKPFDRRIRDLERGIQALNGHRAWAEEDFAGAYEELRKAGGEDSSQLAMVQFLAGKKDEAIAAVTKDADRRKNEVQPSACLIDLLWRVGKKDEAKRRFDKLRTVAGYANLESSPVFTRLLEAAEAFGYPSDWRTPEPLAEDIGNRVDLESLGPFRWAPPEAAAWTLKDDKGDSQSLKEHQGRPVVLIFYLGIGCLHCVEQLHTFAPKYDEFKKAGIEVIGISSDEAGGLKQSIDNYDKGRLPIPLVSDPELNVFKKYRCFDDFEKLPLHGTFIISPDGKVLWQDISYEPFMDPDFVLTEANRLLRQRGFGESKEKASAKVSKTE